MRSDLQKAFDSAKSKGILNPLVGKGMYEFTETQFLSGEQVLYLGTFNVGILTAGEAIQIKPFDIKNKTAGVFVVTSKRVLHCQKILFNTKTEQIALDKINNLESKGGLLFSVLRIQSITNVMEIDIPKNELGIVTRAISEAIEMAKASTPSPTETDPLEKIKKLGELRASGLLTDEEFAKKKEELLKTV